MSVETNLQLLEIHLLSNILIYRIIHIKCKKKPVIILNQNLIFLCFIQSHSEIYPSTLNVVSNCPSRGEYNQTSLTKCAEVCGSYMQDGDCAYHCMRDSSKTKLVEFCAKPKPFFGKNQSPPPPPSHSKIIMTLKSTSI